MTDLPTINIKGKEYILVKDRILAFNELYKNGCIQTEIISPLEATTIIIRAIVTPDVENGSRQFVDYSQATIGQGLVNTTSALENASTSAVGRALALMGIGIIDSVASADEMFKAGVKPGESSEVIGRRIDNATGCKTCFAPAGKPHASGCKEIL